MEHAALLERISREAVSVELFPYFSKNDTCNTETSCPTTNTCSEHHVGYFAGVCSGAVGQLLHVPMMESLLKRTHGRPALAAYALQDVPWEGQFDTQQFIDTLLCIVCVFVIMSPIGSNKCYVFPFRSCPPVKTTRSICSSPISIFGYRLISVLYCGSARRGATRTNK